MRPEARDAAYLWDMREAARDVQSMMAEQTLQQFLDDRVIQLAVERAIEIIGEAARRVSAPFAAAHPQIPWRQIIGQRNILAHEYGHIDHALLYQTATRDIPALIRELDRALGGNSEEG